MQRPFTDTAYLDYQYGDSEKLRIRLETHRRYTEGDDDYVAVELHVQDTALVFPDPEPAVRFYATNRIDMVEGWQQSTEHRARLLPLVRARIEAIIAREGSFRVPKSYGYFVADV